MKKVFTEIGVFLKTRNGLNLKNKPKIQYLRVVFLLELQKFKNVEWPYLFDFWPIFRKWP